MESPQSSSIQSIRERDEIKHATINKELIGTFKGVEEEKIVKIATAEIPITVYTPVDVNKEKLVILFHGGGCIICSRKTHQTIVNMLADATKSIWISVEYRLAPEHKYPIWLDDACEVTRHIIENKTAYGAEKTTKIGVAGESSGARMAASLCHTLKNIDFQILICGGFDLVGQRPSHKEFTKPIYGVTPDMTKWAYELAFRNEDDLKDPRVSVLLNKSFDGLPPCLIVVVELDAMRDDSYAYQEALDKAGVKTKLILINGIIHAFFSFPGIYRNACGQMINAVQEFMASL